MVTILPIHTRVFMPPQDAVFLELLRSIPALCEGDVVVITSKIVAIEQGRCRKLRPGESKDGVVRQWAEYVLPEEDVRYGVTLSIVFGAIIGSAGIDESNGDGYCIFLPHNPVGVARELAAKLRERDKIASLGVIISDSHCAPLRQGVVGVAIGSAGFVPLQDYRGDEDLFGRAFRVSQANCADAIAAAACGVMGEGSEATPVAVVRGWPRLTFAAEASSDELLVGPQEDIFAAMMQHFARAPGRVREPGID